jgi:uncharacterized protein (UPF0332 family)
MFNPSEFALLAQQLAAGDLSVAVDGALPSREARLRAAYGRAYYALYLSVRASIVRRYRVPIRALQHGKLYTHLQNSRAGDVLNDLGREMERMYTLRQKADYDLSPSSPWQRRLTNSELILLLARQAAALASSAENLDFTPILHLF